MSAATDAITAVIGAIRTRANQDLNRTLTSPTATTQQKSNVEIETAALIIQLGRAEADVTSAPDDAAADRAWRMWVEQSIGRRLESLARSVQTIFGGTRVLCEYTIDGVTITACLYEDQCLNDLHGTVLGSCN